VKTVAIKLPEEMLARVDRLSRARKLGRSEVIREALRRHLETGPGLASGSFAERAQRYLGSVRGPRDLSHHERHMKDYGR
jgi:Arc/MetJ-type ribon-helix-helix transcriptional regulator